MKLKKQYDVVIIGAGVTGTSLAYVLAHYTNVSSIALIEKYAGVAEVNSKSSNNSQTLHVGDIETNYSLEKARSVKSRADMIVKYAQRLSPKRRDSFLFTVPKMVLAVGDAETKELEKRFQEFCKDFPYLKKLSRATIAKLEPAIVEGRDPAEKILALGTDQGYAVDFGKLAESLLSDAKESSTCKVETSFGTEVSKIGKEGDIWRVKTNKGNFDARAVVVAAGSTSLLFARMLGYGPEMSIIPISSNFYFTPEVLKGKVYTVQSPKLPFAAIHGDPDVAVPGKTRFGPTAQLSPVLERKKYSTTPQYFKSAGLDLSVLASFA
jgi:malate dehydrogenase (quinone)